MSAGQSLPVDSLIIEKYRIIERVGGGAMAQVYRVEDITNGEQHALKVLQNPTEDGSSASVFAQTARREAGFLKTLSHPALPRYQDLFSDDNHVYLLMEFIEGPNLKEYIEADPRRKQDINTILHWGMQICNALDYLHCQTPPIVFRDLKPSNLIRRPDNRICLVNFGIARYANNANKNASDTVIMGSPGYAPPEQYGKGHTDARSDIYSFGATMHHLLTGRDPSLTPFQWPSVRSLHPKVPLPLDKLIARCVDLKAENRPRTAEIIKNALQEILAMIEAMADGSYANPYLQEDAAAARQQDDRFPPLPVALPEEPVLAPLPPPIVHAAIELPVTEPPAEDRIPETNTVQYAHAAYTPIDLPDPAKRKRILQRFLVLAAIVSMLGSLGLPLVSLMSSKYEPTVTQMPAAANSTTPDGVGDETEDPITRTEIRTREHYRANAPLRFFIGICACLAFLLGGIYSDSPKRSQYLLSLGGTLALIGLTALTLLPARPDLLQWGILTEALLALPAILLLADRSPEEV